MSLLGTPAAVYTNAALLHDLVISVGINIPEDITNDRVITIDFETAEFTILTRISDHLSAIWRRITTTLRRR
jgi:hypothetical protein